MVSDSPFPPLLSRPSLSLAPIVPVLLNLDSIFSVSSQHRISLTGSVFQRDEKWGQHGGKLGQSRHPAGKSPTVYVEGGEERSMSHVWRQAV